MATRDGTTEAARDRVEQHRLAAEARLREKVESERSVAKATAAENARTDERLLPGSATWRSWIAARSGR